MTIKLGQKYLFVLIACTFLWNQQASFIAQKIAIENRALTPLVNAMTSSYQTAISAGLGSEPKSAIIKIYEQVLGTEFSSK